jgi:hypothetical protein
MSEINLYEGITIAPVKEEDVSSLEHEGKEFISQAEAYQVVDANSYSTALLLAAKCAEKEKLPEKLLGAERDLANKLHKSLTQKIGLLSNPFGAAKRIFSQKSYSWKKLENDRLAAEEAKRIAEEKKRLEDEKLTRAAEVEAAGDKDGAERILEESVFVAPKPIQAAPKINGVNTRENWQYRIVDEKLIPREYLCPDEKKIGKIVKANGTKTNIPGIEVFDIGTVVIR